MIVKVLGPGCPKCAETLKLVQDVIADTGSTATVEKVSDFQAIARMGVFTTPAVIVDDQIKCAGRVPARDELKAWLG